MKFLLYPFGFMLATVVVFGLAGAAFGAFKRRFGQQAADTLTEQRPIRVPLPPDRSRGACTAGVDRLANSPQHAFEVKPGFGHRRKQHMSGGLRILQGVVVLELVADPLAHIREPVAAPSALRPDATDHPC